MWQDVRVSLILQTQKQKEGSYKEFIVLGEVKFNLVGLITRLRGIWSKLETCPSFDQKHWGLILPDPKITTKTVNLIHSYP